MSQPDEVQLFTSDNEFSRDAESSSVVEPTPRSSNFGSNSGHNMDQGRLSLRPPANSQRRHGIHSSPPPARHPRTPISKWNDNGLRHALASTWPPELANLNQSAASSALYELYPIVVTASLWGKVWASKNILFHCDNSSTVFCINKGRSKFRGTNAIS